MKKLFAVAAASLATITLANASHIFVTPVSVSSSTSGSDLWSASNLIQGPGVGFDAADPHNSISDGPAGSWVTSDPGGFPSDYIAVAGAPVLIFDLGADMMIGEIHTWGYNGTNANGVQTFSLRFATDAEGSAGFGTSIAANPTFGMDVDPLPMQTNSFGNLTARYIEFTAEDNYFGGQLPGGDRVGMSEVSFSATIPEPSIGMLGLLSLVAIGLRRRR